MSYVRGNTAWKKRKGPADLKAPIKARDKGLKSLGDYQGEAGGGAERCSRTLSGNDVKCCREEGSFLPKAEGGLSYPTTSIYRNRAPFSPLAASP